MKFKVGDRISRATSNNATDIVGQDGEVTKVDRNDEDLPWQVIWDDNKSSEWMMEDEIEFNEVYHSPLYQALK